MRANQPFETFWRQTPAIVAFVAAEHARKYGDGKSGTGGGRKRKGGVRDALRLFGDPRAVIDEAIPGSVIR